MQEDERTVLKDDFRANMDQEMELARAATEENILFLVKSIILTG